MEENIPTYFASLQRSLKHNDTLIIPITQRMKQRLREVRWLTCQRPHTGVENVRQKRWLYTVGNSAHWSLFHIALKICGSSLFYYLVSDFTGFTEGASTLFSSIKRYLFFIHPGSKFKLIFFAFDAEPKKHLFVCSDPGGKKKKCHPCLQHRHEYSQLRGTV